MTMANSNDPFTATKATPYASISCPVCEHEKRFEIEEMEEHEPGRHFTVSSEHRYDHCEDCGCFIDFGLIWFQVREREASE